MCCLYCLLFSVDIQSARLQLQFQHTKQEQQLHKQCKWGGIDVVLKQHPDKENSVKDTCNFVHDWEFGKRAVIWNIAVETTHLYTMQKSFIFLNIVCLRCFFSQQHTMELVYSREESRHLHIFSELVHDFQIQIHPHPMVLFHSSPVTWWPGDIVCLGHCILTLACLKQSKQWQQTDRGHDFTRTVDHGAMFLDSHMPEQTPNINIMSQHTRTSGTSGPSRAVGTVFCSRNFRWRDIFWGNRQSSWQEDKTVASHKKEWHFPQSCSDNSSCWLLSFCVIVEWSSSCLQMLSSLQIAFESALNQILPLSLVWHNPRNFEEDWRRACLSTKPNKFSILVTMFSNSEFLCVSGVEDRKIKEVCLSNLLSPVSSSSHVDMPQAGGNNSFVLDFTWMFESHEILLHLVVGMSWLTQLWFSSDLCPTLDE